MSIDMSTDGVRFELTIPFPVCRFSRPVPSTTRPPIQVLRSAKVRRSAPCPTTRPWAHPWRSVDPASGAESANLFGSWAISTRVSGCRHRSSRPGVRETPLASRGVSCALRGSWQAQNTFPRTPHETGSAAFDRIWVFSRHSTCMGRSTRCSAPAAEACVDAGAGGVIGALALAN